MSKYNVVKSYYKRHLWNAGMLDNAVGKWITEEEHKKILEEVAAEWAEEEAQRLTEEQMLAGQDGLAEDELNT